jgi:nucleoside 2-deoxyribosyltransferase
MDSLRVYVAGPFFSEPQRAGIRMLERVVEGAGYTCHSPSRDGLVVKPDATQEDRKKGFQSNLSEINKADVVVAWTDWLTMPGTQVRVIGEPTNELKIAFPPDMQKIVDAGMQALGLSAGVNAQSRKTLILPGDVDPVANSPKGLTLRMQEPGVTCALLSPPLNICDSGTAVEIGYACFANKVIIGVTMIEGQINLMLAQAAVRYCHSPEELAETLKDIIPLLSPGRDDDSLDAYAETHRYGGSVQ